MEDVLPSSVPYRTLNGKPGGKNGLSIAYEQNSLTQIALYNLEKYISEQQDVADQYPEVVTEINVLAQRMRSKLGNALLDMEGREIGLLV